MKKDIYVIKNSINDKVYVGQAKNAAERWLSHIYNAQYEARYNKEIQVIHRAMTKYGIDKFYYQILEHQVEDYDEREQYWIKKLNSVTPNGYNIAPGGKGTGQCINAPTSIFKSQEELLSCISEISSTSKTFTNIAMKYGCSPDVIIHINDGSRYHQDNLEYPLRATNYRYSLDLVKQIKYSLKYELDLKMNQIAEMYGIDISQVNQINQGRIYFVKNDKYPLRSGKPYAISEHVALAIIDDLKNSDLANSEIAEKYNVSRPAISRINWGKSFKNLSDTYPIRSENDPRSKSSKKFIDIDIIKNITNDLDNLDFSINDIAAKYDLSVLMIKNINNGYINKYRLNNVAYPIRKLTR